MATRIPDAVRNAVTDAVTARIDAGAAAGTVQIRTGAQPPSAGSAASGTLLVEIPLNDAAFAAAAAGVGTMDNDPIPSAVAVAGGDAGWFRILDSNGATVLDGSVTASGGGGQLQLASVTITVGLTVRLTAGTVTTPAST